MGDRAAGRGGRTVAVVGGGIAGLAAAWELTGGATGPDGGSPHVVVLEASGRLGGKVATAELAGAPVDVGPDGFLGRRPEAAALCREVGLADRLAPIGATGAAVWARGRRRPLPEGLFLGVPTRWWPVARSGILGLGGTARLLADVVAPRPDRRGPLGDRAIGPLVSRKLGHQVVQRLVDPLLGGIYAGSVTDASAAAVLPVLLNVSQRRASFMRGLRRAATQQAAAPGPPPPPEPSEPSEPSGPPEPEPPGPGGGGAHDAGSTGGQPAPAFWTLDGGLGTLTQRLCAALARRGVRLETGAAVTGMTRAEGGGWVLATPGGPLAADAVVLALPAPAAAGLLAPHDTEIAALLRTVEYASIAVVTLSFPDAAFGEMLQGTGLLVPQGTPLPRPAAALLAGHAGPAGMAEGGTCMVTACTYLWAKWPHLARPGERLLRASVGRFGDDRFAAVDDEDLVTRVTAELDAMIGVSGPPSGALVTRWPDALPQYRVHHLMRVAGVEAAVTRLGRLAVAGAAYRGVGLPACVASGRHAAREVLDQLEPASPTGPARPPEARRASPGAAEPPPAGTGGPALAPP